MNIPEKNTCILSYTNTRDVMKAIRKLQAKKFNMTTVSIVGDGNYHEQGAVGVCTRDRSIHFHGSQADFWEQLWQLLKGELFLAVPEIGSLVAAGSIASLLVKEHDGIDIHGFSILGVALFTMGVPVESISQYEAVIKTGRVLLIVNAERGEVERSCEILHSDIQQATVHLA